MIKVVFMGFLFSKYGVGLIEEKVRVIVEVSQFQIFLEVCSFLGLVGFSVRFIFDFVIIVDFFRKFVRKGELFVWGEEQEKLFQRLKS